MINKVFYIDNQNDIELLKNEHDIYELIIKNININEKIIELIITNNVQVLRLINCYIENSEFLGLLRVKELDLTESIIEDISYINNIETLSSLILDNIERVDLTELTIIKKLTSFSIYNVKLENEDRLFYLANVEKLRIDNTNIEDLTILLSLENLKYLVVSEEQVIKDKKTMQELIHKGVKIVDYRNQLLKV